VFFKITQEINGLSRMIEMRRKIKILFVYLHLSSFVKADFEILQRHFEVTTHQWTRTRDIKNVLRVIWHILRTDLSFIWFADIHATRVVFLSNLFRKKTMVVIGGYEVANVPEINYGLMLYPKSARRVKYVLENADEVLAVSEFNKNEILNYTKLENIELVYNGIDSNKFKPAGKKEDIVITVAHTISDSTIKIKGLETFIKSAKYLQNVKFLLVGRYLDSSIEQLKAIASSNVEFIGLVQNEELINLYQKAKVYCQISYRESFGMALAEAMLCECAPVVTDRGAMPEVVGDTGFYVPYGDPEQTAQKIEEALRSDKGKAARARIKTLFPLEKREEKLVKILNALLYKK